MAPFGNLTRAGKSKSVDFVSDTLRVVFLTINHSILASAVAVFGIVTNLINIIVFFKQGIGDTINISLLALAVSDLCSLMFLQLVNLFRNPLFIYQVPVLADEAQHLSAAWPHACFARITSWITVYITLERCLCVIIPLKVKRVVTPTVTIYSMVGIYLTMFLTLIPDYATCYMGWKFSPAYNQTMLGLIFLEGREKMAALSFVLSAATQITAFCAVILCTATLVIRIQQISKWRQVSANNTSKESYKRNQKTIKMVLLVAVIYCVCFLPMMTTFTAASVAAEFIIFGPYHNMFLTAWSFAFLVDSINSSVNIFVYYNMSTKYRTTFVALFQKKQPLYASSSAVSVGRQIVRTQTGQAVVTVASCQMGDNRTSVLY